MKRKSESLQAPSFYLEQAKKHNVEVVTHQELTDAVLAAIGSTGKKVRAVTA